MRADLGADPPHPLHDGAEVDRHSVGNLHAEGRRLPEVRHDARGADHGLRGDAADVEAVPPQEVPLDQGDAGAEPRGAPAAVTSPAVPAPTTTRL